MKRPSSTTEKTTSCSLVGSTSTCPSRLHSAHGPVVNPSTSPAEGNQCELLNQAVMGTHISILICLKQLLGPTLLQKKQIKTYHLILACRSSHCSDQIGLSDYYDSVYLGCSPVGNEYNSKYYDVMVCESPCLLNWTLKSRALSQLLFFLSFF